MRDLIKTVLGMGITVGLSDRDAFVKKVAGIIEQYQHNPEQAEKWATGVIAYLEGVKDNINTQNAMKDVLKDVAMPDREKIEELTRAIKELTKEMQNLKK